MFDIGKWVTEVILYIAGLLRQESAPGYVVILLISLLIAFVLWVWIKTDKRLKAVKWMQDIFSRFQGSSEFSENIEAINADITGGPSYKEHQSLADAWKEYHATLIRFDNGDGSVLRNSVRPGAFLNHDDLHFGAGFWKIVPGLFVTVGLFLTFLGLVAALHGMGESLQNPGGMDDAMKNLLLVASAKFMMSLTGLFCSIVCSICIKIRTGKIDEAIHRLNKTIESRLSFISLESNGVEQLAAIREQLEHSRSMGIELVGLLGRPLSVELPRTISEAIAKSMAPLLEKVGNMSTAGVGDMVQGLSTRISADVGTALKATSSQLETAADKLNQLVGQMNQSSGNMGTEMEGAIKRLSTAVETLKLTMEDGAKGTADSLRQGSESILAAMNTTLASIEQKTGQGAQAIKDAATEMSTAALGIRKELEEASKRGGEAAEGAMTAAGERASDKINKSGDEMLVRFNETNAEINKAANLMAEHTHKNLLAPIDTIAQKIAALVESLERTGNQITSVSNGMGKGATAANDAAVTFRVAADVLTAAAFPIRDTVERIERSTQQLAVSTNHVAASTQNSVKNTETVLQAAKEFLGGENDSITATLSLLNQTLERMRGQGDRLDEIDEKLGGAFEKYNQEVSTAVESLFDHVRNMRDQLNPALDTLREIVESAEQFNPQSR